MFTKVERFEDMSPRGRMRLIQQKDGDIIIALIPDPNSRDRDDVEFCLSGGQSPHTLKALRELLSAMERDNAENPQDNRRGR